MPFLIDTDIYIYLTKAHLPILKKIHEVGDENIYFSSITIAELYFGVFNSRKQAENLERLRKNLDKLQILDFNKQSAQIFGQLKAELKRKGTPITDMDLAIASIAIRHHYTLVTHNTRHFQKVPHLILEDWY